MSETVDEVFRRVFGDRFEKTSSGCWLWRGRIQWDGYGEFAFSINGRQRRMQAHRAAWQLAHKRRAGRKLEICHTCDVRACINPAHLFEGTHSVNERDKVAKGRHVTPFGRVGERSIAAKLTDAQVLEIRRLAQDPATRFEALADDLGVSNTAVYQAAVGFTFSHLPCTPPPRRKRKAT